MAAAFLRELGGDKVTVLSAGSTPAEEVNPAVIEVMSEVGIDLRTEKPKLLTSGAVEESDVVITMGCGDACPVFPGKRYLDWKLDDPAGLTPEGIRPIRDDIRQRVEVLLGELVGPSRSEV